MAIAAGDQIIIFTDAKGKPVALKLAAPAAGDKIASVPSVSGKCVSIPLASPAAGDTVLVAPTTSGKTVAIKVNIGVVPVSGFTGRYSMGWSLLADQTAVITGGIPSPGTALHDVYHSNTAGSLWTQQTAAAGWATRHGHRQVTMSDGSLIITGGLHGAITDTFYNDVWKSIDNGINWTCTDASAAWWTRSDHGLVCMPDDTLVLFGGRHGLTSTLLDSWTSADAGATWTQVNANNEFGELSAFGYCRDGTTIYVACGLLSELIYQSDVWKSTDNGATWTEVCVNITCMPRFFPGFVCTPTGRLILAGGGKSGGDQVKNDVWWSDDHGATWTQKVVAAEWPAREAHAMYVNSTGHIFIVGGYDGTWMHDVWKSTDDGLTWTKLCS